MSRPDCKTPHAYIADTRYANRQCQCGLVHGNSIHNPALLYQPVSKTLDRLWEEYHRAVLFDDEGGRRAARQAIEAEIRKDERERLSEWLLHDETCPAREWSSSKPDCDCGLERALSTTTEEPQ